MTSADVRKLGAAIAIAGAILLIVIVLVHVTKEGPKSAYQSCRESGSADCSEAMVFDADLQAHPEKYSEHVNRGLSAFEIYLLVSSMRTHQADDIRWKETQQWLEAPVGAKPPGLKVQPQTKSPATSVKPSQKSPTTTARPKTLPGYKSSPSPKPRTTTVRRSGKR